MPLPHSKKAHCIVQITDSHLGPNPGDKLLGLDTDFSLQTVLDLIVREQNTIDVLLATGDLSNSGHSDAYRRFDNITKPLSLRRYWLPGNHDLPTNMTAVPGGSERMAKTVALDPWQILLVDSTVRGEVGGHLAESELVWLEQVLSEPAAEHTLICLHHHPVPCGAAWLDEQQVDNSSTFLSLIQRFDHVRGVLWGHIHQQIDRDFHGIRLMATPSTCIQFAPGSVDFKLDRANPGYRWLALQPDGRIESSVSRVKGVDFTIDYDRKGGY